MALIKKMSKSVLESHFRSIVAWYVSWRPVSTVGTRVLWDPLELKYVDWIGLTTDAQKVDLLMNTKGPKRNPHFWYLNINDMNHNVALLATKAKLLSNRPWTSVSNPKYTTFEDYHNDIKNMLNRYLIKDVVWYDVALYIVYFENQSILPKDIVYVHAKPLKTATEVMDAFVPGYKIKNNQIPLANIPSCIRSLTAYQIEDLFCVLWDSFKRVWENHHPTPGKTPPRLVTPLDLLVDPIID